MNTTYQVRYHCSEIMYVCTLLPYIIWFIIYGITGKKKKKNISGKVFL